MKHQFVITLLFLCNWFFGQEFILTPNNFVDKDDESKNYIVLSFPDETQKQLFDKTKIFIHSRFQNLKGDGLNEVEYSHLKLRSRTPGTKIKALGSESLMSYLITTYEINFKDGKAMIKPHFNEFESNDYQASKTYLTGGNSFSGKSIFNKDGKIWLQNYYNAASDTVNSFVKDLKEYLTNKQEW